MKQMAKRWLSLVACLLLVCSLAACGTSGQPPKPDNDPSIDIDLPPEEEIDAGATEINAVDYGVDNTGFHDMTGKMIVMHRQSAETGLPVYYPNGTYLFNGDKLDFSSGVQFESTDKVIVRNSISETPIFQFDDAGNFIGLMHNHLELNFNQEGYVDNGNLVSPPLSTAEFETYVDVLPYWYNDFGLQHTALADGKNGWTGWYDWRWNHHDCDQLGTDLKPYPAYNPELHPLLGYYRGDDPFALDWICYWLQEYGVKQAVPYIGSSLNSERWSDPSSTYHWIYQLLNHTPNAKQMDFAFYVPSSSYSTSITQLEKTWWTTFDTFYFNETYKDMVYCYEKDGKRYPVIVLWDELAVWSSASSPEKAVELYAKVAESFKDNGYDGVMIMAQHAGFTDSYGEQFRKTMAEKNVIWVGCEYAYNALGAGTTYPQRIDKFHDTLLDCQLYAVATGMQSHVAHGSRWDCRGSTPEDFGRWMRLAIGATQKHKNRPPIITCYNVSEWGEGGNSLIPTVGNRFGYLEALRDAIVKK